MKTLAELLLEQGKPDDAIPWAKRAMKLEKTLSDNESTAQVREITMLLADAL